MTCGGGWAGSPAALGRRLSRGESLVEALEGEGRTIPPLYRAVVEAGARSGRLPVALEGLARYVRGYSEARAAIGLALWYPILVLALAYGLFVGLVSLVVPRFLDAFESLRSDGVCSAALAATGWVKRPTTGGRPDRSLLVVLAIAWIRSGAAARFQTPAWRWLRLFPWMKSILANYETANFSELLALLLEHHVAYPSALVLAAESTGNPRLTRGARQLAEAVTRGEPAGDGPGDDRPSGHFSPCCAGFWRRDRSKGRWSRPCTTSPISIASAPSTRPRSWRCSCPRSSCSRSARARPCSMGWHSFYRLINMLRELTV